MSKDNYRQRYLFFAMFIFCFIAIPGILMLYGISYLRDQERENLAAGYQNKIFQLHKSMQPFSDGQKFWCTHLNNELNENLSGKNKKDSAKNILDRLALLKKSLKFEHIVFAPDKGIIQATVSIKPQNSLLTSLKVFQKRLRQKRTYRGYPTAQEEKAIGEVFGPQLNLKHLQKSHQGELFLTWPDSTFKKPLLWCKCVDEILIVILIDYANLDAYDGIKSFLARLSLESERKIKFAIINRNNKLDFIEPDRLAEQEFSKVQLKDWQNSSEAVMTANFNAFPKFIRPDLNIIAYFDLSATLPHFNNFHFAAIIVFIMISLILFNYAFKIFIKEVPDSLSLKWKLRFLFFFANGLPLLVLFFLGTDYLNQKRDTLLQEILARGTSFIQSFDQSFESEYAKILVNKRKAETKLIQRLRTSEMNDSILKEFVADIGDYEKKILLVASRSETLCTEHGLYDPKKGLIPENYRNRKDSSRAQLDFTRKVGHYFVDSINGTKISDKIATEIEILVESITQKPVVNFIFDMMQKRGNFSQWGFGRNVHPAILDTFSLGGDSEDYFFLAMFRKEKFQLSFMKKTIPVVNRNNLGLKIVAFKDFESTVPTYTYQIPDLKRFAATLTSFPGDEIKFVDLDGEEHLAMGFKGNSLTEYSLIGLYPVSRIANLITRQKKQLTVFALLSLLVTFALSQILAHSFLTPLGLLSVGAKAIEEKHFSHRLPEMSHDEFGKMGEIFNDVMVDLDELSVASAIQEQLLPQGTIDTGQYSLFGRSISMGELGGDYYDFIALPDHHFSIMLGDVAGHGVGAALIMAMAKAGIIQSDHLLHQPLELINRLHGLIYNSKTKKQKKIMTFQYLYLDSACGKAVYANAGACSPMIIRKSQNKVEELKLAGAALGAFRKANFSQIDIHFQPGDAIVFYTDGIVEARNDDGEEMGYEELKTILLKSWDIDAEKFYQNIYQSYIDHLGSQSAQDDLTMIVLVFRGENPQEKVSSPIPPQENTYEA
jgi:hypothetical protein